MMKILLELNQRFGHGYQIHFLLPPIDWTYDATPLTLFEAGGNAKILLDEVNKERGTDYEPDEVISITGEGLEANRDRDVASHRFLKDIETGTFKYSTPAQADYQETDLDGEKGFLISGRGVALYCFFAWKDDKMPKARAFLEAYCRLVAARGCKGGATKLFQQLDRMDDKAGARWIKETYARHIRSGNEVIALFQNVTS